MDINNNFSSITIEQIANQYLGKSKNLPTNDQGKNVSFDDILKQKQQVGINKSTELKFSKHASARLVERNINLTNEQFERLENGTKKAEEKGINESLMIMDDLTFIVNIKSNTVVTAMDQESNNGNVFTNIDGAVIV